MSVWRIGTDATHSRPPQTLRLKLDAIELADVVAGGQGGVTAEHQVDQAQSAADSIKKAADIYTKWIPGDVLAVYIALTAAFRGTRAKGVDLTPHAWGILIAGFALAAGLSLLGAIAANLSEADPLKRAQFVEVGGRALLAVLAFGFWSLTTPGAWWEVHGWNMGVLAAITFATSVVFALVAETAVGVLRRGWP